MSNADQFNSNEDEISLKEIILIIQDYFREFIRNWKLIGILIAISVALFVFLALRQPVLFPAEITFMVNEDEGGQGGSINAIIGQFGFGGSSGDYNLDKIVELSKSMRIVQEALFERGVVGKKEDFYINHIIRSEKFHEKWKRDTTGLKGFLFTRRPSEGFTRTEYKALKKVYVKVRGNPADSKPGLISSQYEETTNILSMKAKTQTPALSIGFLNEMYEKVSDFYIKESTEKAETTYNLLKDKRDSLFTELGNKEFQLARAIDSNIGLISKSAQLKIDRLERDVQMLTIAYGKALENTAVAEFSLQNATPFFQIIDRPIRPLSTEESSLVLAILIGGFLGGFLGVLIVIGRRLYRQAMA